MAGEPTGDGDGLLDARQVRGGVGEKVRLSCHFCSPWLLEIPDVLTPGLRAPSVPMGRSSIEPDRSWNIYKDMD